MDVMVLVAIATLLCLLLAVPMFFKKSGSQQRQQQRGGVEANRGPGGRRAPRMRRQVRDDSDDDDEEEDRRNEDLEELEEAGVKIPDGKIGKKKMEKLQAKADKKLQREAEQREREEAKKKREKEEEEERKRKDMELMEEKKKEEEERRLREEQEKREYEEYLKLKEAFSIDEEGCDANDDESGENKLQKFITYIKETKVVLLEDLGAHFKMKTQDAIDRVKSLQESGDLTGVVDDRGKFIYVSREELESVAKFIKQQGRVSISDLASNSNKLITLS